MDIAADALVNVPELSAARGLNESAIASACALAWTAASPEW